jgi:hypothetical protein
MRSSHRSVEVLSRNGTTAAGGNRLVKLADAPVETDVVEVGEQLTLVNCRRAGWQTQSQNIFRMLLIGVVDPVSRSQPST